VAVQLDPIQPTLKAPGIKLLNLKFDKPLSNFAFKFKLRRFVEGYGAVLPTHDAQVGCLHFQIYGKNVWFQHLKQKYNRLRSSFAFNFSLGPYTQEFATYRETTYGGAVQVVMIKTRVESAPGSSAQTQSPLLKRSD
jgi:hypothetical protein